MKKNKKLYNRIIGREMITRQVCYKIRDPIYKNLLCKIDKKIESQVSLKVYNQMHDIFLIGHTVGWVKYQIWDLVLEKL
jgi:hypothetical protein